MKKFLSLVLTLCLVLSVAVNAMAERVVLQDAAAPALVGVKGDNGETVYAVIFDKDNNEVARITDPGQIILQDMTSAEGAAGIENQKLDYMLVMFEKFQVTLSEDAVAKLPEGGYVQMVFGLMDWQPAPSMVTVTTGEEITNAVIVDKAQGTVTVKLPVQGVVSFLIDASAVSSKTVTRAAEEAQEDTQTPQYNNFTPSVSGKAAPALLSDEDYAATICSTLTEEVTGVPASDLIITAVADRDFVADVRIHGGLEWAFSKISTAATLNELPVLTAEGLGADIDKVLADMGSNLTYKDMIVRDLFAVNLFGDLCSAVAENDKYLNVTFDMGLAQGTGVIALLSSDNVNWSVLPADAVTVNADGSVSVKLPELGNVAFAVSVASLQTGMVTSPATGE